MEHDTGQRPYILPGGKVIYQTLPWCRCSPETQRGPKGGVCGRCGKAIKRQPEGEEAE